MTRYDNICYSNSSLSQVIFRIDFASFIDNKVIFHESIIDPIISIFPAKEMERISSYNEMEVETGNDGTIKTKSVSRPVLEKTFRDKAMRNKVILSNNAVIFEYNQYGSFEQLNEAISTICDQICRIDGFCVSRVGLRYINLFNTDSSSVKVTRKMFEQSIVKLLVPPPIKLEMQLTPIRSISLTEYVYGEIKANFRVGTYNRYYPSPISKDDFVIDIDCFMQTGINSLCDISTFTENAHTIAQQLFEGSITDSLRKAMSNDQR